ncbi:MAG: hypothetical protein JWN73_2655 [Betaproteobacteria bacterium]|nr:hypothetical protein [Betaproteobacteria bacterium]
MLYRIIVVDDNEDAADTLHAIFALLGHAVRVFYSPEVALAECELFHPHVVVSDLGMPEMTGYELAAAIRKTKGGSDIVLIALSGWGDENARSLSKAAGFDSHLVKPTLPERVLEIVDLHRRNADRSTAVDDCDQ